MLRELPVLQSLSVIPTVPDVAIARSVSLSAMAAAAVPAEEERKRTTERSVHVQELVRVQQHVAEVDDRGVGIVCRAIAA